jgi:hypothetical protein
MFRQDCTCPALLKDSLGRVPYGALTHCGAPFQMLPVQLKKTTGLVRVRSPLLTESRLMSFPPATEMFQFAGFASRTYEFSSGYPCGWVAPFGDPGINDCSHLPRAYRSVPRPSSPLSAKASTRCPYYARSQTLLAQRLTKPATHRDKNRRGSPIRETFLAVRVTLSREDTLPQRQVNILSALAATGSQRKANETPASVTLSSPCQRTLPKALNLQQSGSSTIVFGAPPVLARSLS